MDEKDFQTFFSHLKQEVKDSGEDMDVGEAEARDLFAMMKSEFSDLELQNTLGSAESSHASTQAEGDDDTIPTLARGRSAPKKGFGDIMDEVKEDWGDDLDADEWSDEESSATAEARKTSSERSEMNTRVMESEMDEVQDDSMLPMQSMESYLQATEQEALPDTLEDDFELEELKQLLPGMPVGRLRKVQQAYLENLTDPSFLTLVPILRERMPVSTAVFHRNVWPMGMMLTNRIFVQDWLTTNSIRKMNMSNAQFVMEKAKEADLIDTPMLNGMLQVYTSVGSIDNALELYQKYQEYNMVREL